MFSAKWIEEDQRFAFSDQAPASKDWLPLTEDEHAALMAAQAQGQTIVKGEDGQPIAAGPAPSWESVRRRAGRALRENDLVATRCTKAGVPYPGEWKTYDATLRAIVSAPDGDPATLLPSKPAYPSGT